jgi:hypothetical protein
MRSPHNAVLKSLDLVDSRQDGGPVSIIAGFDGDRKFSRNIERPFSMDEVGKAFYLLATDIMRAALGDPPGILNLT